MHNISIKQVSLYIDTWIYRSIEVVCVISFSFKCDWNIFNLFQMTPILYFRISNKEKEIYIDEHSLFRLNLFFSINREKDKQFLYYKRPSARRGPGIVSVDRNVRSKCRCSCVLQFTIWRAISCVLHRPTSQVIHRSG